MRFPLSTLKFFKKKIRKAMYELLLICKAPTKKLKVDLGGKKPVAVDKMGSTDCFKPLAHASTNATSLYSRLTMHESFCTQIYSQLAMLEEEAQELEED